MNNLPNSKSGLLFCTYASAWTRLTCCGGPNISFEACANTEILFFPLLHTLLEVLCAVHARSLVMVAILFYAYSDNITPRMHSAKLRRDQKKYYQESVIARMC